MEDIVQEILLVAITLFIASLALYYYDLNLSSDYTKVVDSVLKPINVLFFYDNTTHTDLETLCADIKLYILAGYSTTITLSSSNTTSSGSTLNYIVKILMSAKNSGKHIKDFINSRLEKLKEKYLDFIEKWTIKESRKNNREVYTIQVNLRTDKVYTANTTIKLTTIKSKFKICFTRLEPSTNTIKIEFARET